MEDDEGKMVIDETKTLSNPINPEANNLLESQRLHVSSTTSMYGESSRHVDCNDILMDNRNRNESFDNLQKRSKLSSSLNLSNLFTNQSTRGKGVLCKSTELCTEGMSLRMWLNHGFIEANKAERLQMYRNVVQVVDSAHSQGMAFKDLRLSNFILLPSNEIRFFDSSQQYELSTIIDQNKNGKRAFGQDYDFQKNKASFQPLSSVSIEMEKKWYACPEEHHGRDLLSANIYSLGILLFELLCSFESLEKHSAAMSDLRHRILPPSFISDNPQEAGFCLWLLHPHPSSRPTTREILQSELLRRTEDSKYISSSAIDKIEEDEADILHDFLTSLKEQTEKHALELHEHIGFLETDINNVNHRPVLKLLYTSNLLEPRLKSNMSQLESAYINKRSQVKLFDSVTSQRNDLDLLDVIGDKAMKERSIGCVDELLDGICKFSKYSKFQLCGALRIGNLLNSSNVVCSLTFDHDEDYIAAAGVSKKIKIFEFVSLLKESIDVNYPSVELTNKSKLSSVCWNKYLKNYLASADYDGVIQMWDASTGQRLSHYTEHQRRAWSVDFSRVDPTQFASGSDDCLVKLWSLNEKTSIATIRNAANVCCVQFSPYSSHLLAFGSANYKTYCYDLRNARIPWCTLAGHQKAVSYVKFSSSDYLVSASTDNTLKHWDLKKTSLEGVSADACCMTYKGHANEKNFVGLSVMDGYIACGSESNEVYSYHTSFPMPITSYNFGSVDPVCGGETDIGNGQFVSSVCWREKSNMLVAANSGGSIKVLKML